VDAKTKPHGALGRLEELAVRLAAFQRTLAPRVARARVLVFAADHGVARAGVSAYPRAVTAEMARTFARGHAAINVFARSADLELDVVDVGVDADLEGLAALTVAKVARGTADFTTAPAMTEDECARAVGVGHDRARRAADDGVHAVVLGEMGIGNTTSAAALLSALTGAAPARTVGRGTGVDDARLAHKRTVVERALDRHAAAVYGGGFGAPDAMAALATLGGLEIAALAGATIEAATHGLVVVVDGFIATVAVLAAAHLEPAVLPALVFAHRSAEAGHGVALDAFRALGLDDDAATPLLDLALRLGEGTGGALAVPLVRAAARMLAEMATFESAGVSGRDVAGAPA
jgi:nicotinate-nucleotide--dimethylbenzimidazole phosphoribosyltransferase